jgi:hypothetical protein
LIFLQLIILLFSILNLRVYLNLPGVFHYGTGKGTLGGGLTPPDKRSTAVEQTLKPGWSGCK